MDVTPEPSVAVPSALAFHPTLPRGARQLWITLVTVARDEETVALSVSALATVMRAAPTSIRRWRADLVELGWLSYEPGGGRGNVPAWTPLGRIDAADVADLPGCYR